MKCLVLPGIDIKISRLSFGTASLHHLPSSRNRQYLLEAAADNGFTHFDTSPYYGFGLAEEELGCFLKSHRNGVTVATKVGLYPPAGANTGPISVMSRKILGKFIPILTRPVVDWSLKKASQSLGQSLRRLGLEQIDFLFLHEPVWENIEADTFLEWFQKLKQMGKIRAWGLAGNANNMDKWLLRNHPLSTFIQLQDSLENKEADILHKYGRDFQITYGYLSSARHNFKEHKKETEVLKKALERNSTGSILISTRRLEHLHDLVAVEKDFVNEND